MPSWPALILSRGTAEADPENYTPSHVDFPPFGVEAETYVPKARLDSLIKGLEEEASQLREGWTAAEVDAGRRLSQLIEEARND